MGYSGRPMPSVRDDKKYREPTLAELISGGLPQPMAGPAQSMGGFPPPSTGDQSNWLKQLVGNPEFQNFLAPALTALLTKGDGVSTAHASEQMRQYRQMQLEQQQQQLMNQLRERQEGREDEKLTLQREKQRVEEEALSTSTRREDQQIKKDRFEIDMSMAEASIGENVTYEDFKREHSDNSLTEKQFNRLSENYSLGTNERTLDTFVKKYNTIAAILTHNPNAVLPDVLRGVVDPQSLQQMRLAAQKGEDLRDEAMLTDIAANKVHYIGAYPTIIGQSGVGETPTVTPLGRVGPDPIDEQLRLEEGRQAGISDRLKAAGLPTELAPMAEVSSALGAQRESTIKDPRMWTENYIEQLFFRRPQSGRFVGLSQDANRLIAPEMIEMIEKGYVPVPEYDDDGKIKRKTVGRVTDVPVFKAMPMDSDAARQILEGAGDILPQGNGQRLTDHDIVRAFQRAAGGDRAKAEELARQYGWEF